jgi:formamidopyrimidine-DNA glycosylase
VDEGGTSFAALYVSTEGMSGLFERSLAVYGRQDQPCSRCGAPIRREPFMNRSPFSCPGCQVRPRSVPVLSDTDVGPGGGDRHRGRR